MALGVAGVVGVAVMAGSLTRFVDSPLRDGWGWTVAVTGAREGKSRGRHGITDRVEAAGATARHRSRCRRRRSGLERVPTAGRAVTPSRATPNDSSKVTMASSSCRAARRRLTDEVALGSKTLRRASMTIGRSVDVDGKPLRVVGTAVFPGTERSVRSRRGRVLQRWSALGRSSSNSAPTRGARRSRCSCATEPTARPALARLTALNDGDPPAVPPKHAESRTAPAAGSFAVLPRRLSAPDRLARGRARARAHGAAPGSRSRGAANARLHTTTDVENRQLAGDRRSPLSAPRSAYRSASLVGRYVWVRIADSYGIANDPAWPWVAIVLAVPVAVVLSNAIAWWPARRAAGVRPAQVLRTE